MKRTLLLLLIVMLFLVWAPWMDNQAIKVGQSYEGCMPECKNSDNPWFADIDCSEYCKCVEEHSNDLFTDFCVDFRVGKPNISHKINITPEEAVGIAKSTPEVREFLSSGESNNVSGIVGPVPYNCSNKNCSYKYIVDYSYDIRGRVIFPWSKKTGSAVSVEIDATTGGIMKRWHH